MSAMHSDTTSDHILTVCSLLDRRQCKDSFTVSRRRQYMPQRFALSGDSLCPSLTHASVADLTWILQISTYDQLV